MCDAYRFYRKDSTMLVLTRKRGEKVLIGDNITVTVTEICADRIRIGIDAPRDIDIVRDELVNETRKRQQ
jgi:carbon storage regulator